MPQSLLFKKRHTNDHSYKNKTSTNQNKNDTNSENEKLNCKEQRKRYRTYMGAQEYIKENDQLTEDIGKIKR